MDRSIAIRAISLFLLIVGIHSHPSSISNRIESDDQAMRFVKIVQKRYYLVHRLEKPVEFLVSFYGAPKKRSSLDALSFLQSNSKDTIIVPAGVAQQFKHPAVIKCMKMVEEEKSLRGIQVLWSDFLSYKFIEDELFVRESVAAVIMVYKALVVSFNKNKSSRHAWSFFSEHKIEALDQELTSNLHSLLNLLDESYDKLDFVITNNVRHYHIQRLLKSIATLTEINKRYLGTLWSCIENTVAHYSFSFKHPAIQASLESIVETKTLHSLFALWRDFIAYKFANDALFLQEFVALEYMIYGKLIECLQGSRAKDVPTVEDLIELYTSIATLPIPEMLNSLDLLVEELTAMIEKYELNTTLGWTEWFKKYWWVPPVIIASVVVNFALSHREDAQNALAQ